eukprot:COSAG06_NODE_32554_length_504_cov_0.639506_1_plen_78_part_10
MHNSIALHSLVAPLRLFHLSTWYVDIFHSTDCYAELCSAQHCSAVLHCSAHSARLSSFLTQHGSRKRFLAVVDPAQVY